MKKIVVTLVAIVLGVSLHAQSKFEGMDKQTLIKMMEQMDPQPAAVTTGSHEAIVAPPSDAIVLFDGSDISQWTGSYGKPASWDVRNGVLYSKPKSKGLRTKEAFGDCQLHVEWMIPKGTEGEGQQRGNSGVFLQEQYEVQVLDSYQSKTYVRGQAGSVYKQHAPLVNVTKPQGEWNSYDIIFTAPTFKKDGTLKTYAKMTVLHNGVLIQNNVTVWGATAYVGVAQYKCHGDLPIMLQDHNNEVAYRNIWVRDLR